MKLNAGSGEHYVQGWVNVEAQPKFRADLHADLASVPLPGGSVEKIFACHVLEHVEYRRHLPLVLAEFRRLLAPGGQLCVVGPDAQRAILLGEPPMVLKAIAAWTPEFSAADIEHMHPPAGHAWTATELLVELALERARFSFENYSGNLHKIKAAGWPLSNLAAWQNGYVCAAR